MLSEEQREITGEDIDCTGFEALEEEILENADYEEIKESAAEWIADGRLAQNTFLLTSQTHGYYLDFLADHPGESFLLFTDGTSNYFLSEDNTLYRASNGTIATEIAIEGDCYHAFPEELTVSYEKIMSRVKVIGE